MFRKTRVRIVASIMAALILLFTATLLVIVFTEYYQGRQESAEMLDHYIELYSLDHLPGDLSGLPDSEEGFPEMPEPPAEEPLFQLSTFYSVSFSPGGDVLAVDISETDLYTEEALTGIARRVLEKGNEAGSEESLMYRVVKRDGYTLVAFRDNTAASAQILSLIRHTLLVGGCALVVLFFLSVYLARRIIRPLEEADQKQKQFISDAGHELKTPVSVISTNAELLSRQIGPNEWMDNIVYENKRMGDLVTQLLDLSRAENARMPMESLDFSRLVVGEALPFESVAFEKGLSLQTQIEEGITLQGSRSQLSQLVSILLDNAIRHSRPESEIRLTLERQGRHALLQVENKGEDISPEAQAHLFERFYRIDDVRNSESGHYGLGLSIAKAITEAHGGYIRVSSENGTIVFSVTLPLKN